MIPPHLVALGKVSADRVRLLLVLGHRGSGSQQIALARGFSQPGVEERRVALVELPQLSGKPVEGILGHGRLKLAKKLSGAVLGVRRRRLELPDPLLRHGGDFCHVVLGDALRALQGGLRGLAAIQLPLQPDLADLQGSLQGEGREWQREMSPIRERNTTAREQGKEALS